MSSTSGEDPEKARARRRRWIEANPEKARECARRGSAKWKRQNPDAVRAANARWVKAHPEENRLKAARTRHAAFMRDPKRAWTLEALSKARLRAKEKGLPFDLETLECPDVCPVLGIPLVYMRGRGRRTSYDDSPSVDRLRPEVGYVKGNVQVISARANRIKNDATLEDLERVLAYVRSFSL